MNIFKAVADTIRTFTVNAESHSGKTIELRADITGVCTSGNKIILFVDGQQKEILVGDIKIEIQGDVQTIEAVAGDVAARNVGSIKATHGDVTCGDVVHGDVATTNGNVDCGNIAGNVKTTNGNIDCGNIAGNVQTVSGDVTAKGTVSKNISTVSGDVNIGGKTKR